MLHFYEFIEEYEQELERNYKLTEANYYLSFESYIESEYESYIAKRGGWESGSSFIELY